MVALTPSALSPIGATPLPCDLPGLNACQRVPGPHPESGTGYVPEYEFKDEEWGSFSGSFGVGAKGTPSAYQETHLERDGVVRHAIRSGNQGCRFTHIAEASGKLYARGLLLKKPAASFIVTWNSADSIQAATVLKLEGSLVSPSGTLRANEQFLTMNVSGGSFVAVDLVGSVATSPSPGLGPYVATTPTSFLGNGVLFHRWQSGGGGVWWWNPAQGVKLFLDGDSQPYLYQDTIAKGDWVVGARVLKTGGALELWRLPSGAWQGAAPETFASFPELNTYSNVRLMGKWAVLWGGKLPEALVINVGTGERRRVPACASCVINPSLEQGGVLWADGMVPGPFAAIPAIYRLVIAELPKAD